jgi:hypothetical protein
MEHELWSLASKQLGTADSSRCPLDSGTQDEAISSSGHAALSLNWPMADSPCMKLPLFSQIGANQDAVSPSCQQIALLQTW